MTDLIVIRDVGGIGDLIRIFCILDALADSGKRVAFCCDRTYSRLCEMCPSIADGRVKLVPWDVKDCRSPLGDGILFWSEVDMPYATGQFHPDTPVIDLLCPALKHEVICGGHPTMDRVACWAHAAGIVTPAKGSVKLVIPGKERREAKRWRTGLKEYRSLVAVSPSSNASVRTYRNGLSSAGRTGRVGGLRTELNKLGMAVAAFGDGEVGVPSDHDSVCSDIVVQAARIAACDLFIGPDSGFLHIAAALGVPCIGLFGPTDPRLVLMPYAGQIKALSGSWNQQVTRRFGCTSPCNSIEAAGFKWQKCGGRCEVLEQIDESSIAAAAQEMLRPTRSLRK